MDDISKNEKNDKAFKSNRTTKNSPVNKSPTMTIPYNRKKILNHKKLIEIEQINLNNNLSRKRNNLSENLNKKFCNKEDNKIDYKKPNKINNKVINININYNDKYNYYDRYQNSKIEKRELSDIDFFNNNMEYKKYNSNLISSKKNTILEINLNNTNINKTKTRDSNKIKNSILPSLSIIKDNNNQNNSFKIKKFKEKRVINSIKTIVVKSNSINNKRKIIEAINNKKLKNEEELINNSSNIIKDENIILFLNEKNNLETRKKGFCLLNEFIMNESNDYIIKNNSYNIFMFIYFKLNYFQEKNILLLTEGLSCILHIFENLLNKKNNYIKNKIGINTIEIIIKNFKEKITNIIIKNIFFKLLTLFFKLYSINDIFDILISNISINLNNAQILKEYLIFIKKVFEKSNQNNKDNLKNINIKKLINFLIQISNFNNSELKSQSHIIICLLYTIYGKVIIDYLKEKNEPLLDLEKELKNMENNQINIITNINKKNKRNIIGQSKSFMVKNKINLNNNKLKKNSNNIMRKDISKSITTKLLSLISSEDFSIRKKAINYINKIITENKNISIKGLRNLFFILKNKINDTENYAGLLLELLSNLITALGIQIKIYSNILIYPLLLNLSNKSQDIREKSYECIEKWIKIQGFNTIRFYIPELLNNENNNITMKLEILKLLLNNYYLIEIHNNEDFILKISKSLINCLINNSMIIRNNTEKLIKKLNNIIQKELYIKQINNIDIGINEKEYLYKKIDELFSNNKNNKNINKILIQSINKVQKQNSFSKKVMLLSEITSDNENNSSNKNTMKHKPKILEGRNLSNNSINALNLKAQTLPLNRSTGQLSKRRKKNSLIINDKTIFSFLNNAKIQSPNIIKYSNNNTVSNRKNANNSLRIKRRKTETDKFNKLIYSSIILPSKIRNNLDFDDKSKCLPDEVKQEIQKLKTMQNMNVKKNNFKILNSTEKKKNMYHFLNINHHNSRKKYFSQVFETEIYNNKKNLFDVNYESYIFSSHNTINNLKIAKKIRYDDDKIINFDIKEILNFQKIQSLKIQKYLHMFFSHDFIQNIFNDNIEKIVFDLSKLNKLIDKSILNHNNEILEKIINNLDLLLRLYYIPLSKYNNNDSLTKTFFIFIYSIIKLSETINYIFNEIEIIVLLNILCNNLNNKKKIITETSYNLIFFLSNQCKKSTFIIILAKLLEFQNYEIILETIKIIHIFCEKCKYDKEIMSEIVEYISKIYFYNFNQNDYIKNQTILPILINIFDSIGNKFWEKCLFLSKEKKEILSKKIFENRNNLCNRYEIKIDIIDEYDQDLININKKISMSSSKKQKSNNSKIFNNYKNKINNIIKKKQKKIKYIIQNQLKEKNSFNKLLKRNKTSESMKIFQNSNKFLSKFSSNNISFDLKYLVSEENDKSKDNDIESKIFNSLNIINSEQLGEDIIIKNILALYNLIYKNYIKYTHIFLKNFDKIIDTFFKKIKILSDNLQKGIKIIKYIFNILYKLCLIDNFFQKITLKTQQKFFFLLISSSINKNIKIIKEKNHNNLTDIPLEDINLINDCKIIVQAINSIIIYIIKNLDITNNILIIINIIKNNRNKNIELVEYSISCLTLIIQKIKEKYSSLKVKIILREIQILINNIKQEEKNSKKNKTNKSIMKVIIILFLEIAKYKKEDILESINIQNENINDWIEYFLKNNNEYNKGFLFEGETLYPRKIKNINKDNKNIRHNYSPEERIESNFKNIKKKWIKIHKNK